MSTAAADYDLGPLPRKVTGSCQCGKVAYRIDFPEDHPFKDKVYHTIPN